MIIIILLEFHYNTVSNSQTEISLIIYARYLEVHTFEFSYNGTFSFYEDTKCVQAQAILMPAKDIYNSYYISFFKVKNRV